MTPSDNLKCFLTILPPPEFISLPTLTRAMLSAHQIICTPFIPPGWSPLLAMLTFYFPISCSYCMLCTLI